MNRVLIIGNAAAGKSTFAKKLSCKTKLPLIHLDNLYWQENWQHPDQEKFDEKLEEVLNKKQWIVDGNYNRTLEKRLLFSDTLFYFDFPVWICLWQATKRTLRYYGKERKDGGKSCFQYFDRHQKELYKSIFYFNRKYRQKYTELLSRQTRAKVIVFKNRKQVKRYLKEENFL